MNFSFKVLAFFGYAAWSAQVEPWETTFPDIDHPVLDDLLRPVVERLITRRPNASVRVKLEVHARDTLELVKEVVSDPAFAQALIAFFRDIPKAKLDPAVVQSLLLTRICPFLPFPTLGCLLDVVELFGYAVPEGMAVPQDVLTNNGCPVGRRAARNKVLKVLCQQISQGPSADSVVVIPDPIKLEQDEVVPDLAPSPVAPDEANKKLMAKHIAKPDKYLEDVLKLLGRMREETDTQALKSHIYGFLIGYTKNKTLGDLAAIFYYSTLPCQEVPRSDQAILLSGGDPHERSLRDQDQAKQHINHQVNMIARAAQDRIDAAEEAVGRKRRKATKFVPVTTMYDTTEPQDYLDEPDEGIAPEHVGEYVDSISFHLVGVSGIANV